MTDQTNENQQLTPAGTPYPVDASNVSMEFTEEELQYEIHKESLIEQGVVNPRFIRYHEEDSNNPAPRTDTTQMKYDYRSCKLCSRFNQENKVCEELQKYMPIAIQFEGVTCPLNKWE